MMPGQSNQLSKEKKAVAELEDAIAERIAHLKDMSAMNEANENNQNEYAPIEEYCKSLFSEITQQSEVEIIDPSASQMNAAQALALLAAKSDES